MEYDKMKQYHDAAILPAVCARCFKPMRVQRFTVGRFTYGSCCIEKVQEEQRAKEASKA